MGDGMYKGRLMTAKGIGGHAADGDQAQHVTSKADRNAIKRP